MSRPISAFSLDGSTRFAHRVSLHVAGFHLYDDPLQRFLFVIDESDHAVDAAIGALLLPALDPLRIDRGIRQERGAMGEGHG
jgi:hypothetical protein